VADAGGGGRGVPGDGTGGGRRQGGDGQDCGQEAGRAGLDVQQGTGSGRWSLLGHTTASFLDGAARASASADRPVVSTTLRLERIADKTE
jgi:hypothetical protein